MACALRGGFWRQGTSHAEIPAEANAISAGMLPSPESQVHSLIPAVDQLLKCRIILQVLPVRVRTDRLNWISAVPGAFEVIEGQGAPAGKSVNDSSIVHDLKIFGREQEGPVQVVHGLADIRGF